MSLSIKPSVVKDGFRYIISSYLIALEGYRRGLKLEIYDSRFRRFSLTSKEQALHFNISLITNITTEEACRISKDKEKTKEHLREKDIPVPEGRFFQQNISDEEIMEYGEKIGFPLVIKPYDSYQGKGVVVDVKDKENFRKSLTYVRKNLNKKDILIERYIKGAEYRIYVIKNNVVAVLKKVPANVKGNGKDTIVELIELKNQTKSKNPHRSKGLIKIDDEIIDNISKNGYTLGSVLEENKVLFLRKDAVDYTSLGGDSINVTDSFPKSEKDKAVKAVKAIPGLYNAGVDMILDVNSNNQGTILELNSRAGIGSHAFPCEGESVNVASDIIDTYFPETLTGEKYVTKRNNVIFNLKSALKPLVDGSATSVKIRPAPIGMILARKIEVVGAVDSIRFKNWIRKKVIALGISGNIKSLNNNSVRIIVAGKKSKINQLKDDLVDSKFAIEEMNEEVYRGLIRVGFEII